jgi:hypothetical protein
VVAPAATHRVLVNKKAHKAHKKHEAFDELVCPLWAFLWAIFDTHHQNVVKLSANLSTEVSPYEAGARHYEPFNFQTGQ